MNYPYDPDLRDYTARLLYDALPALYKLHDERARRKQPPEPAQLEALIRILAAPLAVVRQSIEELYADLFIDSAADWVLPYLARMVDTELIFPDADSNRRDIRGTVGWRRRKGTPSSLQDMGEDLTGQLVTTREGWKQVQMSQDLNFLRDERRIPRILSPSIAETSEGPMATLHHTVDARSITRRTGKYHPRHITHWVHPTRFFPVDQGTPAQLGEPPATPDRRYAIHPLGKYQPIRCRRSGSDDPLPTDRILPMMFAEDPSFWFGRRGRVTVNIAGIPAAVAQTGVHTRPNVQMAADSAILSGSVTLTLLHHDGRRFSGPVRIDLAAVPFPGVDPLLPDTAAMEIRSTMEVDAAGQGPVSHPATGALPANALPMLRLVPVGSTGRRFPGAVISVTGGDPAVGLGAADARLAREGFLRGALLIEIPPLHIDQERWFYLAADGSLFEAQSAATGPLDVGVVQVGPPVVFDERHRVVSGPGPAWPPLPASAESLSWLGLPAAPNTGPVFMHGGQVLVDNAGSLELAAAGVNCALSFAMTYFTDSRRFEPMLRLEWNGPDPASAVWFALGTDGRHVNGGGTPVDPGVRFAQLGEIVSEGRVDLALAIRFECDNPTARLSMAEVSFTAYDGDARLIYLPDLPVQTAIPDAGWNTDPARYTAASVSVTAGRDGSSWLSGTTINLRRSLGQVAPLAGHVPLIRRRVHGRTLCQWINETPPALVHAATPSLHLDVDAANGLFSLAAEEPARPHPAGPEGIAPPPSVSVTYQEGYSDHVGARCEPRQPALDARLPSPTRIVSGSGHLPEKAPIDWLQIPRYAGLTEALAAVAADPLEHEVITFADNATYEDQEVHWPAGPDTMTLQAGERVRPIILVQDWVPGTVTYRVLSFTGLAIHFTKALPAEIQLAAPPAREIHIRYCTFLRPDVALRFFLAPPLSEDEGDSVMTMRHCVSAGLSLDTDGQLEVCDSVIDTGKDAGRTAVDAPENRVRLDRVTVFGDVRVHAVDASESIFMDPVLVRDRFQGCIRYSRVTSDSVLPRTHRLAVDTRVEFVSVDRHNPAHARLAHRCDPAILSGAEDGGEMGVFHDVRLAQRYKAFQTRLKEYTPAGLVSGMIRID